jgi:hypothetical protein
MLRSRISSSELRIRIQDRNTDHGNTCLESSVGDPDPFPHVFGLPPDPDPLVRGTDPGIRIRISTKMSEIHNIGYGWKHPLAQLRVRVNNFSKNKKNYGTR